MKKVIYLLITFTCVLCIKNLRHKNTIGNVEDLSNNVGIISSQEIEVTPPLTKQQYQINKASEKTTHAINQALKHTQNNVSLLQVKDDDVINNIPFMEETIDQMTYDRPADVYENNGNSPDMGSYNVAEESTEAPMTQDNELTPSEQYYSEENIINEKEVSLVQINEIDALENIDTSMPLFGEDVNLKQQETPLNSNIEDPLQNQEVEQDINNENLQRQTDEMVNALQGEIEINEASLIQIGFY